VNIQDKSFGCFLLETEYERVQKEMDKKLGEWERMQA
jgi:hypothetical protein